MTNPKQPRKWLLGIMLLSIFTCLQAQNSQYSFTLEEAIKFALDSSYTTQNARRDIAKAIKQKWETTASGLPQISGNVNYQNFLKQPVTLIPAEFSGGTPGTFTPVVFGTNQNATATATLNQLIFDGSYLVGLQAAETFLNYSKNASKKAEIEVRNGVINAYGSVLVAQALVSILEQNKTTLEKNLHETEKLFENGFAEEESVEQLRITLLDIEAQLRNAIRSKSLAKQMFNLALGIPIEATVTLTEHLDAVAQESLPLKSQEAPLAIENNIDYKIAFNLTEQRALELKLERSKALPSLSAFVNYGAQANSNSFTFFDGNQQWFQSSLLGFQLNVPLFSSGMRNAKTQQAKIALTQSKTQLKEAQERITLAYESAKSNFTLAGENYQNAKHNLALAQRIESKNQLKYKEGLASSFELRQAQIQLYAAQQQHIQSMLNLISAKAEIERILSITQ